MSSSVRFVPLAAALLCAPLCFAQDDGPDGPPPPISPEEEMLNDMRGVTLMAGAGAEGYSGKLAKRIQVGPAWGAVVVFKPSSILGIEIAYTGSIDRFDPTLLVNANPGVGASVLRTGGHAAISVGLAACRVQPYLMAGVGINHYTIIGAQDSGYRSVANATLPLGAGLRVYFVGKFTMDIRANYALNFGPNFAGGVGAVGGFSEDGLKDIGRWSAAAYFGYTF